MFHFKIDANKNGIEMKKQTFSDEDYGKDPIDKALKCGVDSIDLFPRRVDETYKKLLIDKSNHSKQNKALKSNRQTMVREVNMYEVLEDHKNQDDFSEDLSTSKILWANRIKMPNRGIETNVVLKDSKNKVIMDPKYLDQPQDYLRINACTDSLNEKSLIDLYYKVMEAACSPMHDKYDRKKLLHHLLRLVRACHSPIFSGAVDPMVNLLDFRYANDVLDKRTKKGICLDGYFNRAEINLLDQFDVARIKKSEKAILSGGWKVIEGFSGSTPPSMEGTAICFTKNSLYLFGGFSRDVYDDMRICDFNTKKWTIVTPESRFQVPPVRHGHTMNFYNDKLIIFGGAGKFSKSANMRVCYKDMHIFNTQVQSWVNAHDLTAPCLKKPEPRMYHASAVYGPILMIHGGFNTENKHHYSDLFMYDLD